MCFKCPEAQATFALQLDMPAPGGLPVASVERWGNGLWVRCCPLCGCVAEIKQPLPADGLYTPNCPARRTHPHVFAAWQAAHPEIKGFSRVVLVSSAIMPLDQPAAQPEGKAA